MATRSYFIDKDDGPLSNFHIEPTIVVNSKNGDHAYFACKENRSVETFKSTQKKLIAHYDTDKGVNDLARVMRLPGFPHLKDPSDPFMVKIKKYSDQRYSEAEVIQGLKVTEQTSKENTDYIPLDSVSPIPEGKRYNTMLRICGSYKGRGVPKLAALSGMLEENQRRCKPPMCEFKIRELVDSIYKYEDDLFAYSFNDLGRAEGFSNFCDGNVIYTREAKVAVV